MPTRPRTRARASDDTQAVVRRVLRTGRFDVEDGDPPQTPWLLIDLLGDDVAIGAHWAALRSDVLRAWVKAHPGTRPWCWWTLDAPRWALVDMPPRIAIPGAFWIGRLCEPRQRLGGIGTPEYECLNTAPRVSFGLPMSWVSGWQASYYNGLALDVHGQRIGTEYHEGHFPGRAIDPADPPRFESQAAYLQRHGLLDTAERKRLTPDAFDAEIVAPASPGHHSTPHPSGRGSHALYG